MSTGQLEAVALFWRRTSHGVTDYDISACGLSGLLKAGERTTSTPVMLKPRGQTGLEAKHLASASASRLWPQP